MSSPIPEGSCRRGVMGASAWAIYNLQWPPKGKKCKNNVVAPGMKIRNTVLLTILYDCEDVCLELAFSMCVQPTGLG